jgi:outer membrane protein TolC
MKASTFSARDMRGSAIHLAGLQNRLSRRVLECVVVAAVCAASGCAERRATLAEARPASILTAGNTQEQSNSSESVQTPDSEPAVAEVLAAAADHRVSYANYANLMPSNMAVMTAEVAKKLKDAESRSGEANSADAALWRTLLEEFEYDPRSRHTALTLQDCIRRAVDNSLSIKVEGFSPAVGVAQVVEAEAQFDAVYFLEVSYLRQDTPSPSELLGSQSDRRSINTGLRKMLETGAQVQTAYTFSRTFTDLAFVTLNPAYDSDMIFELRQPLLRDFGIDFNRSQIETARNNYKASLHSFRRNVRDTLQRVEQTYWQLVQARQSLEIQAAFLVDLAEILRLLKLRAAFDALQVEIDRTESRFWQEVSRFIELRNGVREVEDLLKSLLNDPELNLAEEIELDPVDRPLLSPVIADSLSAMQSAMLHRSEIHEAILSVETARVQIGAARNQTLPRLDLVFRYIVNGLGQDLDRSFDEVSKHDFVDYQASINVEVPIGNRQANARLHRARLQYAQARASARGVEEDVTRDVRSALRTLNTNFEKIFPGHESAKAAIANVNATKARAQDMSPSYLEFLLSSYAGVASSRAQLVQSVIEYNTAMINLERAKGSLLRFYRIAIAERPHDETAQR